MQIVQNDGCALNVRLDGASDGRVVMFGNSLGTDLRVWDLMLPYLPAGLRIVRYDKRGHGLSNVSSKPVSIETLASDAAAIADHLALSQVTFVGLSIGGLIGQSLALMRSELLSGLVLMDTAAKIGTDDIWNDRIAAIEEVGLEGIADGVMERWFSPAMLSDPTEIAVWRNMLVRTPQEGYISCCKAIAAADFTGDASRIDIPIMAMAGTDDQATSPELVKGTADLYSAPFHLIEGAGHLPCVEKPEETARIITKFLEAN